MCLATLRRSGTASHDLLLMHIQRSTIAELVAQPFGSGASFACDSTTVVLVHYRPYLSLSVSTAASLSSRGRVLKLVQQNVPEVVIFLCIHTHVAPNVHLASGADALGK